MVNRSQQYRATASKLAADHRREDPGTADVFLFPDSGFEDIRLLEVSRSAPRSGDVLPFRFEARPDIGVPFPSVVILLSPDEWKDVQAGTLKLPADWDLSKRVPL